ncbi:MAG TPA: ribonuclease III [Methylibium sp.]|uniref:ribonuclease III n=1 Tax=Methylibium sp. TaxID=2067992 RepID=UPI002DB86E9F|nr:ribonuclease III [Methylibium sp.]HEU4458655.1 ribonuclease III [Methylibium sp.]
MPALTLEATIGHRFAEPQLLDRALTHKSFGVHHNERLEFLGDAVLSAAISGLLFARFVDSAEGDLTRVRAHLVREETLHSLAIELGLPAHLRLSEAEARSGGAQRASILADALEAVIGAVYLDGGFEPARALVQRLFAPRLAETAAEAWSRDPKTALQEALQARRLERPAYRIAATRGRAHEQLFVVVCTLAEPPLEVQGEGRSRRAAEQDAARAALAALARLDAGGKRR